VIPWDEYEPWQRDRFDVLPGLTGLWQVSGKNRTTFQEMIELDLRYIRRRCLGLDLWILGMTLPAILRQCWEARRAHRAGVAAGAPTQAEEVAT
jgi:lipopolysaccharide/colanic/teichoic acid biosynthesis glycosyltransferase